MVWTAFFHVGVSMVSPEANVTETGLFPLSMDGEVLPYALTLLQIHEIHGILKKGEFLWIQMI